jgi:ParB family chromosome partitioning protein
MTRRAAAEEKKEEQFKILNISDVSPNPDQPRKRFDREEIQLMADSIQLKGQIKPVDVRPLHDSF